MPEPSQPTAAPLLLARGLVKDFRVPRPGGGFGTVALRALDGVDLEVGEGESVAVVGESGSGKSTLGRALTWLDPPDQGEVRFRGEDLRTVSAARLRALRRGFQIVFQDPLASLDPRQTVGDAATEPLAVLDGLRGKARAAAAGALLERVGLPPSFAERLPHALSGGQRQRVAIARAIATKPKVLVADEPVSALDLDLQVQILDLLGDLRRDLGMALVLITHDLALVRARCSKVSVMKDAKVVERGPVDRVFERPEHPYTRSLLEAVLPPRPTSGRRP